MRSRDPRRAPRPAALAMALALSLGAAVPPLVAQHTNHPLTMNGNGAYGTDPGGIDTIDLFAGSLGLKIPIGPFDLTYNSNVWRYEVAGGVIEVQPDREMTAGLGWHLGLGRVYSPEHWYNGSGRWMYEDSHHGRHVFFQQLHYDLGEDDGDNSVLYTRDGTYLRLRRHNNFFVDVEFPDGTVQRFDSGTGGLGTTYRLTKSWDPYTSADAPISSVTYTENTSTQEEVWELTDRYGRVSRIHFRTDEPWLNRIVTRVDAEGFGGARLFYDFSYDTRLVNVSCKASQQQRIAVPHLTSIALPDGTAYSMLETDGTPSYHNVCEGGIEDLPGTLRSIRLPTGGTIAWTFQEYEFPPGEGNSPFNTTAGVETRRLVDAAGTELGVWTYKTRNLGAQGGNDPEMRLDVVAPTGDCRRYFFNARHWVTPSQGKGWEYGLPFVYREEAAGRYLSSALFEGNDGQRGCSGAKVVSSYVRYRHDTLPGSLATPQEWSLTNVQIEATRIVFHDDGDRWVDVEHSDFDGLGNFRRTVRTSNFRSGSPTDERREVFKGFDKVSGSYPGSFTPVPPAEPWILNLQSEEVVEEPDSPRIKKTRTLFAVDRQTGALRCTRSLADGENLGAHDLLLTYERDSAGRIERSRLFGGDLQSLPIGGEVCDPGTAQPQQDEKNVYDGAHLEEVLKFLPDGSPAPYLALDSDVDASTGLPVTVRNTAGTATTYLYDALGRLESETHPDGSKTVHSSELPTAQHGGTSTTRRLAPDGTALTSSEKIYDSFGRLKEETMTSPDGKPLRRTVEHNARGWLTAKSAWGATDAKMVYEDFDALGRPGVVRRPPGTGSDISLSYTGSRILEATLATGRSGTPSTRIQEIDGHGRLRITLEPSGFLGEMAVTTLRYDAHGNVSHIRSEAGQDVQERWYDYDARGFLITETHPELGVNGGGSVAFSDYNALGSPGKRTGAGADVAFEYDWANRLLAVLDLENGSRPIADFTYDAPFGKGLGQLRRAIYHNWVDLPWTPQGVEDFQVWNVYTYGDTGFGAVTTMDVRFLWSEGDSRFRQQFTYGPLGNVATQTSFQCLDAACSGTDAGTSSVVEFVRERGNVTSIPGFVSDVSYYDNGAWGEIRYADGSADRLFLDLSKPANPERLQVLDPGGALLYDSGVLGYDERGRISSAEGKTYGYDGVGRLVKETFADGQERLFGYDAFGNLLEEIKVNPNGTSYKRRNLPVDPSTNRLLDGAYDDAGNLVAHGGLQFEYNPENRLTGVGVGNYLYDAHGERVAEFYDAPGIAPFLRFFLRDPRHRLTSQMIWKPAVPVDREWDYVWMASRLVARRDASGSSPRTEYFHRDLWGNVRVVTGSTFDLKAFGPYGADRTGTGADHRFAFAGHERDAFSNLDAMHARTYSSALGRFLSVDEVRGMAGDPQSLNRYSYADGNPLAFVDPDGRDEANAMDLMVGLSDALHDAKAARKCGALTFTTWNCWVSAQISSRIDETKALAGWRAYNMSKLVVPGSVPGKFGKGFAWGAAGQLAQGKEPNEAFMGGLGGAFLGDLFKKFVRGALPKDIPDEAASIVAGQITSEINTWLTSWLENLDKVVSAHIVTEQGAFRFEYDEQFGGWDVFDENGNFITHIIIRKETEAEKRRREWKEKEEKALADTRKQVWRLDSLREGRCIVDPISCIVGSGGGGGSWNIRFFY